MPRPLATFFAPLSRTIWPLLEILGGYVRHMQKSPAVFCICLAIAGCSPIYYPNSPQTVNPVEAGEAIGGLTAGTGGIEGRAAVAPVKNVVIAGTASYLYIPGDESYIKHSYGELSLGWSDTSGRTFYSFIGGAGI